MAGSTNTIATRLTLDGEKEFRRGISSINQELRLSNAQLKEVAATYDLNGNAQERLASKSRILREQVAAQNRIVEQYEERMRQAEQATDLSAEGLRGYSIQLTNARTKAKQLQKELEDTDRELEELGRDSRRAGDQLEDNLGEAAEETESKLQKLARSVEESLGGMKKLQRISVAVDIVRGAWDVGESIANYVQSATEDGMRKAMVQYNITAAGGNLAASMPLVNQYAALWGDKESAYEAVANLVAAGYTDASLTSMGKYVGGAAIRFQDTLKIESLADSIQESLSEGVLTGQISELINRLAGETGITVEQVNAQLAEAKAHGNEKVALEAYLRNAGLDTYYDDFVKQNKALIESAVALQEFNTALNDLAVTTLPMLTPVVEGLAEGIAWATNAIKDAINLFNNGIQKVGEYNTSGGIIKNETPGVVVEKNALEQWGAVVAQSVTGGNQVENIVNEMVGVNKDGVNVLLHDPLVDLGNWLKGLFDGTNKIELIPSAGAEGAEKMTPGIEMSKYVTLYSDTATAYRQAEERNREIRNRLRNAGIIAAPTIETNTMEGMLEGWDGSQWTVVEDVESKLTEAAEAAQAGGQAVGDSLANGLQQKRAMVLAQATLMRDDLERVWRDPITPTVVVGYRTTGPINKDLPPLTVNLQGQDVILDHRKVGSIVGQSINVGWGALISGPTQ